MSHPYQVGECPTDLTPAAPDWSDQDRGLGPFMFLMVPWLSEEPDWEELSDEELEDLRAIAESLGVTFPDPEMPDYYE